MAAMPQLVLALLAASLLGGAHALVSNAVTEWSSALGKGVTAYNIRHQIGLRHWILLHQAQVRGLRWNQQLPPSRQYPEKLVVAISSHQLLSRLLPDQQTGVFDPLIAKQTANYTATQYRHALALLKPLVIDVITRRLDDGSAGWANFTAAPAGSPGAYQLTPGQTTYFYPQLADTTPFILPTVYRIYYTLNAKPYNISSAEFLADLQETYSVGSASAPNSTNFTRDTADFWADGGGTSQHGGHWNQIAIQILDSNLTLLETARLLAALNIVAYDANIVTWYIKYKTAKFWRPVTAIQQGYANFTAVPSWTPYLATPPHPEYPSGHSTTSGAFGWGLATLTGLSSINVTIATEGKSQSGAALPPRTYTSFQDIVQDINLSRIYGGVHYRKAVVDGAAIGGRIAQVLIGRVFAGL